MWPAFSRTCRHRFRRKRNPENHFALHGPIVQGQGRRLGCRVLSCAGLADSLMIQLLAELSSDRDQAADPAAIGHLVAAVVYGSLTR